MAKKIKNTTKFWWVYLVFGIISLIAGGNFCAVPLSALSAITTVTGLFLIFLGASNIITNIVDRKNIKMWWLYVIISALILISGIMLFFKISFALKIIWLFTGLGFALEAAMDIILSINLKKIKADGWVLPLILGIITGIVALSILCDPIFGLRFVSVFVTIGVICFGIKLIVFAFQQKP